MVFMLFNGWLFAQTKLDPNYLSSVTAMFIFFTCPKKTNQKKDTWSLMQELFPTSRMKKKENSIVFIPFTFK
jgi:hypothetical protein